MGTKVIGHMIGALTSTSVSFWIGLSGTSKTVAYSEAYVRIHRKDNGDLVGRVDFTEPSPPLVRSSGGYFKGWFATCNRLQSDTEYTYVIAMNGSGVTSYSDSGTFRSAPPASEKKPFRLLVASCLKAKGRSGGDDKQPVWAWVNENLPDVDMTLLIGDTHYANSLERGKKWQFTEAQFAIREYQEHLSNTPVYAIYDDHDFLSNNEVGAGNKALQNSDYGDKARRVKISYNFNNLWIVPKPGNRTAGQGCYQKLQFGSVDIYLLDTRYYREPLGRKAHAMCQQSRGLSLIGSNGFVIRKQREKYTSTGTRIGNRQWDWLETEFEKYRSMPGGHDRVKLVCFGSTLNRGAERLRKYEDEVEKLKALLSGHKNVLFLTGDRHKLAHDTHPDFSVEPAVHEVISSGMGRVNKDDGDMCGGFVVVDVFRNDSGRIDVRFFQPLGDQTLPDNFSVELWPKRAG